MPGHKTHPNDNRPTGRIRKLTRSGGNTMLVIMDQQLTRIPGHKTHPNNKVMTNQQEGSESILDQEEICHFDKSTI